MVLSQFELLEISVKVKYLTNGLSEIDAVSNWNGQSCFLRRSKAKNWAENWTIHAEMAKNTTLGGRVPYVLTDLTPGATTIARCATQMRIESWYRQAQRTRIA